MNQSQPEKAERIEEIVKELRAVSNMINMGEKIRWGQETTLMDRAADLLETHHQELQKTRTAEQERVVGKVNRVEVIDHTRSLEDGGGRVHCGPR